MTAASTTSRALAPPARTILRWQRCLAALGLCLPVPVSAASGLSLPLPTTVERLAASLVPWVDVVALRGNEALPVGVSGRIVSGATDATGDGSARGLTTSSSGGAPARTAARPQRAERTPRHGGPATTAAVARPGGEQTRADSGRSEPTPGGGDPAPNAPQSPGGPEQGPSKPAPTDSGPTEPSPESEPTDPIEPVVEEATAPAEPLAETVEETAEETLAPVTGALDGLGG